MIRSRAWPVVSFVFTLAFYLATLAEVHRGDTVSYLLETHQGMRHDPSHLLLRQVLGAVLDLGEILTPGLSPFTLMAGLAAVCGALVAATMTAWLFRQGTGPGLALLAPAAASASWSGWALSTSFEGHGLPLVALLCMALALDQRPLSTGRAALGGLLLGLAVSLHLIAAPVGLAWVALLLVADSPWRARWVRVAVVLGVAFLFLHLAHALTFLQEDHGSPPMSRVYLVAMLEHFQRQSQTQAIAQVAASSLPGAVRLGSTWALLADLTHWISRQVPTAIVAVVLVLATVRARSLFRRHRAAALVPVVWLLASLPLAAWVGAQNYEYYRGTWVALALLAALVAEDLLTERGRTLRVAVLALGGAAVVGLAACNWSAIARDMSSPTGAPVGVLEGPPPHLFIDGRRDSPPFGTQSRHRGRRR